MKVTQMEHFSSTSQWLEIAEAAGHAEAPYAAHPSALCADVAPQIPAVNTRLGGDALSGFWAHLS